MTRTITVALLSLLFAAAGAGARETGPAAAGRGGMGVCKDDLAKLCPDAKDPRAIRRCLDKNQEKLSEPCKQAHARLEKGWRRHARRGAAPAPAAPAPASNQPRP